MCDAKSIVVDNSSYTTISGLVSDKSSRAVFPSVVKRPIKKTLNRENEAAHKQLLRRWRQFFTATNTNIQSKDSTNLTSRRDWQNQCELQRNEQHAGIFAPKRPHPVHHLQDERIILHWHHDFRLGHNEERKAPKDLHWVRVKPCQRTDSH